MNRFKVVYLVGKSRREKQIEAIDVEEAEEILEKRGINWVDLYFSHFCEKQEKQLA